MKTIEQAARVWGVSPTLVQQLISVGLIEATSVGFEQTVEDSEVARILATGVPSSAAYRIASEWTPQIRVSRSFVRRPKKKETKCLKAFPN
jgi:hypothetical protein